MAFENALGMRFVLIPPGTFTMGSPETEWWHGGDEEPHDMAVASAYYLGVTEVTNGQFRTWMPQHDSGDIHGRKQKFSLNRDDQPVVFVSWDKANQFATWLATKDGVRKYRLPTEVEWEYACRAGTGGRWYWGDNEAAMGKYENVPDRTLRANETRLYTSPLPADQRRLYFSTDDGQVVAAPVATYLPNPWGLHDMLGNVSEWCSDLRVFPEEDRYPGYAPPVREPERAVRGGSWEGDTAEVRAAALQSSTQCRPSSIGFRLVVPVALK